MGEKGEVVFNKYRDSAGFDENVLQVNGGDGCTTLRMYLMPEHHTFKNSLKWQIL